MAGPEETSREQYSFQNINEVFNFSPRNMCSEASWVHPSPIINDLLHLEKKPFLGSLSACLPFPRPKTNIASGALLETRSLLNKGNSFPLCLERKWMPWLLFLTLMAT